MNSASHINFIYGAFRIQDIQASPVLYPLIPIAAANPGAPLLPFVLTPFTLGCVDPLLRRGRRHPERIT